MIFKTKKEVLYFTLAGFFITNALVAEMIGGKLIDIGKRFSEGTFIMSVGILLWPVVFLTTDLINEYFGKKAVQKLSYITAGLVLYAFIVLFFAMQVDAISFSPVNDASFNNVFGQSMWIILGSILAFISSQLIDVFVFWFIRTRTGEKMLWLRSTGSTVISQLFDTFIVGGVGLWLPTLLYPEKYHFPFDMYIKASLTGYSVKLLIAVVLTPVIYLGHYLADKYLGEKESHQTIVESAEEEGKGN